MSASWIADLSALPCRTVEFLQAQRQRYTQQTAQFASTAVHASRKQYKSSLTRYLRLVDSPFIHAVTSNSRLTFLSHHGRRCSSSIPPSLSPCSTPQSPPTEPSAVSLERGIDSDNLGKGQRGATSRRKAHHTGQTEYKWEYERSKTALLRRFPLYFLISIAFIRCP